MLGMFFETQCKFVERFRLGDELWQTDRQCYGEMCQNRKNHLHSKIDLRVISVATSLGCISWFFPCCWRCVDMKLIAVQ